MNGFRVLAFAVSVLVLSACSSTQSVKPERPNESTNSLCYDSCSSANNACENDVSIAKRACEFQDEVAENQKRIRNQYKEPYAGQSFGEAVIGVVFETVAEVALDAVLRPQCLRDVTQCWKELGECYAKCKSP